MYNNGEVEVRYGDEMWVAGPGQSAFVARA